jgi:hypothetical protein
MDSSILIDAEDPNYYRSPAGDKFFDNIYIDSLLYPSSENAGTTRTTPFENSNDDGGCCCGMRSVAAADSNSSSNGYWNSNEPPLADEEQKEYGQTEWTSLPSCNSAHTPGIFLDSSCILGSPYFEDNDGRLSTTKASSSFGEKRTCCGDDEDDYSKDDERAFVEIKKQKKCIVISTKKNDAAKMFRGVIFLQVSGRFRARIKIGMKTTHLGYFASPIEAALAYDRAARELHGSKALLNFPDVEPQAAVLEEKSRCHSARSRCTTAARTTVGIESIAL